MPTDPEPTQDDPRPLRADAVRNRERIVAAARELYATRGLGVGLNEIAHHAGLGVGTVYRRFPDKKDLVEAALAEPLREMTEVAAQAMRAERAWDGVIMLIERGADLLTANIGLRDVALTMDETRLDLGDRLEDFARIGCELMDRARAEGDLRPGATNDDLGLILWMVTELATHSQDTRPDAYRRYLRLLIDGLRNTPGTGMLEPALTSEEIGAIAQHWATH
ncbi:TetR/AcrR family transcriptional regulator [Cellulomonas denverensis]|uniref:TetR/AcrR family transcriptional regulator n=1 Tax=Cellulomonas denverensis TaxID=264297 RepID=A0A7X6KTW0_9CELL|nr:TetR/AcrR family transcriptional regulator [Cellulomonas denverensis]NKY21710.1 TetR/AcrR family transcriptional regulator [Cellulomonas denverensis]GIG25632.1 TetR family transcriptional regulator [Cellulomonas denverensis]